MYLIYSKQGIQNPLLWFEIILYGCLLLSILYYGYESIKRHSLIIITIAQLINSPSLSLTVTIARSGLILVNLLGVGSTNLTSKCLFPSRMSLFTVGISILFPDSGWKCFSNVRSFDFDALPVK